MTSTIICFAIGFMSGCAVLGIIMFFYFKKRTYQQNIETKIEQDEKESEQKADQVQMSESEGEPNKEFTDEINADQTEFSQETQENEQTIDQLYEQNKELKEVILEDCNKLADGITKLIGLIKTFERWHAEMNDVLTHNSEMHKKNKEFSFIVQHVIMIALNAAIEAARIGESGRTFAVVATEIRAMASRIENFSENYKNNLHKNDLITTTTFQDLQAGGKMITAAVISLELLNNKIKQNLNS